MTYKQILDEFQFQYGAIKGLKRFGITTTKVKFQFQYGAIKGRWKDIYCSSR